MEAALLTEACLDAGQNMRLAERGNANLKDKLCSGYLSLTLTSEIH